MVNFHTIEHNVLLYCLEIYWSIEMKMENFGQAHKNGIGLAVLIWEATGKETFSALGIKKCQL